MGAARSLCLLLALALPLSAAHAASAPKPPPSTASGKSFRWVDEEGVTHYSDQVPPDQAKQRRSKLDAQGREVAVIEAPKTPEQLRREQQLKQLRAQQDRILAEQHDRDMSLLRSYRNEQEMYRALQGKLDTLDSLIRITEANRQRQQEMLLGHERRAADLERQGQPVPQNLRDLITASRKQIGDFNAKIRRIDEDKREITERFAKDIARYQAIATQRKGSSDSLELGLFDSRGSNRHEEGEIVISAISCAVGAVCQRAWGLAKEYVLKSAGPTLSLETERILQTPAPENDNDFGLTVTRIAGKTEDILFMDVRCRPSSLGEALCAGEKLRQIRLGFKAYIEEGLAGKQSQ